MSGSLFYELVSSIFHGRNSLKIYICSLGFMALGLGVVDIWRFWRVAEPDWSLGDEYNTLVLAFG